MCGTQEPGSVDEDSRILPREGNFASVERNDSAAPVFFSRKFRKDCRANTYVFSAVHWVILFHLRPYSQGENLFQKIRTIVKASYFFWALVFGLIPCFGSLKGMFPPD